MNKKTIKNITKIILGGSILITGVTGCSKSESNNSSTNNEQKNQEIKTALSKIDNSKWLYNENSNVYYQVGISYVENPQNKEYETLGVYIPGEYVKATKNSDGQTYTCEFNKEATINGYNIENAPVVLPVDTPGYSAMKAPTGYTDEASTYTKEGFIYVQAGARGRDSGAPAGVVDLKAAIRYVKYNQGNIAGNTDKFIVYGMSGGGAQSALLGATGDSELYNKYLKEVGAVEGVSDSVFAVMSWCPITSLDTANEAYEWNLGNTRSGLSEEEQILSNGLAKEYAEYINKLGLKDFNGNKLSLEESDTGIYQSGSYYNYIKETIENSLNNFIADTTFPYDASKSSGKGGKSGGRIEQMPGSTPPTGENGSPIGNQSMGGSIENRDNIARSKTTNNLSLTGKYETVEDYIKALNQNKEWVKYDSSTKKVTITSVADFTSSLKNSSKGLGAFDSLDKSQGENELFGYGNGGVHFDSTMLKLLKGTSYEQSFTEDLSKTDKLGVDVQTRINMYSPLYYLSSYYDGYKKSKVAQNWRIRSGINQGDTALSTEVNLALALKNYGISNVDFETVWGQGHVEAERIGSSSENFVNWVKELTK